MAGKFDGVMATTKKSKSTRKTAAKNSAPKKSTTSKQSHEEKLAEQTIKLIDEASSLLRTGAGQAAKSRIAAAKKAQTLLGKATNSLTGVLKDTSSVLSRTVGKLGKP
jgi:hypothetical protein